MNLPQLRRIRWAVRLVLLIGVAASVAANILHAEPNPVSEVIAAWPPLALLLTIELISRVPVHRRSLAAVRLAATAAIAGIAAWVSYRHMVGVAARYGETGASPYLLPLSVDGLVVVASVSLVELAGRIREAQQPAGTAHPELAGAQSYAPETVAGANVERSVPRPAAALQGLEPTAAAGGGSVVPVEPSAMADAAGPAETVTSVMAPATEPRAEIPARAAARTRLRRPVAETRRLAAEVLATEPHLSRKDLAARLGLSPRRLREVLPATGRAGPRVSHRSAAEATR